MTASVRHELMRTPFTITVHAPHWPWSQPFFVPVRPRYSRRASRSVVHGATSISLGAPLTVRVIRDFVGNADLAVSRVAFWICVPMESPVGFGASAQTRRD